MSEIKPCPFCGSMKIRVDKCSSGSRCLTCFCKGPILGIVKDKDGKSEEQLAVEAWNTRKEANDIN